MSYSSARYEKSEILTEEVWSAKYTYEAAGLKYTRELSRALCISPEHGAQGRLREFPKKGSLGGGGRRGVTGSKGVFVACPRRSMTGLTARRFGRLNWNGQPRTWKESGGKE